MGGDAFRYTFAPGQAPPQTPRMSATLYLQMKSIVLHRIRQCLPDCQVETPREAPEKCDFGDIDIVVALENGRLDFTDIASRIGAFGLIHRSGQSCSLAIPVDGSLCPGPVIEFRSSPLQSPDCNDQIFAQVDLCWTSSRFFEWHLFQQSYGDTCAILGGLLSPLGFKVTNTGLWLRLQALEDAKACECPSVKDADGTLLLSCNPDHVMEFLGLCIPAYRSGFSTVQQYFQWLATCSHMSSDVDIVRSDNSRARRKRSRTLYIRFFDEFLPAHLGRTGPSDSASQALSSDAKKVFWQEKAVAAFGIATEHERQRHLILTSLHNWRVEVLLKPFVIQHTRLTARKITEVLRAVRRWTDCDDKGTLNILAARQRDEASKLYHLLADDHRSLKDEAAVRSWVGLHWEEVRNLERQSRHTQI